jgi:murein DD-endopeptidase MepM/ murein hydrolase activator NlpD
MHRRPVRGGQGALAGAVVVILVGAAGVLAEGDRFRKVAEKLTAAINAGDLTAIDGLFSAEMRAALPREEAGPFFKGVLGQKGKLGRAGEPAVDGDMATLRVEAERGSWEFFIALDGEGKISGLRIKPRANTPPPERNRVPLVLPFRGEWYVFWGGDRVEDNYHVKTENQRGAADLVMVDAGGRSHRGDGSRNQDYHAYGQEILAPAAARVVTVIDGVPDNAPGSMNPFSAMGNCVILELAAREFAVFAHLQPSSARVKPGDKVRRGQVLGLCGNSGNSSEPHLHFHLQDAAVLQDGTGFTAVFQDVEATRAGARSAMAEYTFLRGDRIRSRQR